MCNHRRSWLRILVHLAALSPLALLAWDFTQGQLTANPIREIQLRTGKTTLVLLVLSLACRPAGAILGFKQVLTLRRPLGLYAFAYACLHLLNFVWVDYGFDFELIRQDALEKRFALAGLLAFLCLLPLALTSTKGWRRRLGKRWARVHTLVYLAASLAVIHFIWQTKADFRQPLAYGAVVAVLLAARLPHVRKTVSLLRGR